jgi:Glutathione S-transferase, C-terminal domain
VAGEAPGLADIAWYMNFWFFRSALKAEMTALLEEFPKVSAWRERVASLGKGSTRTDMTTAEAIEVARAANPALVDHIAHDPKDPIGLAPGAAVHVVADDYGRDPIAGILVAANPERIVIAREDPRVGRVNVHFPRVGFAALRT